MQRAGHAEGCGAERAGVRPDTGRRVCGGQQGVAEGSAAREADRGPAPHTAARRASLR
ncbi:hypothetical protein [Dactylosporangium sp. CA-139066]|uniref:hypothetical protein n=1 Tax=Dactylosporangium sp. CA-139066 TaxID=3239930 RepID=UPI003D8D8321